MLVDLLVAYSYLTYFRLPDINNAVASRDRRASLSGLLDIMLFNIAPMLIDLFVACGYDTYLILVLGSGMSIT